MNSPSRADFLKNLQEGGRYENTVAIYRESSSVGRVGIFDQALIAALPRGVRWIAHNGAGYDQIDVNACKEKGTSAPLPSVFRDYPRSVWKVYISPLFF
jgi:glyoxylate reductase